MEYGSSVAVKPQRDLELQDQKSAEMNYSVWKDAQHRWRIPEKQREWVADFVRVGEVAMMLTWNPDAGEIDGYEPMMDPRGEEVIDENGDPVPDEDKPVFSGGFEFERLYPFNLLRDPASKNMRESPFLIVRKLVPLKQAQMMYKNDPDKLKLLVDSKGDDFIIFDAVKGGYDRASEQVMFKNFYYKPSPEHPKGYFAITTSAGKLEEGELPFGIWPIVWQGFDEHATAARARSIVKQARPYTAEINRAGSALAMHQITIGDDKILYQSGTKLAPGALLPGVRGISYQGAQPTVLPGRDGSQFTQYIKDQIAELYSITDMFEIGEEKNAQFDPMALLYRSGKQRQKYFYYTQKFEQFMIDVCELFLKLAREYYSDDLAVVAVGRNEMVNMSEFKNSEPLNYRVIVEPQDSTLETKFGRQVSMMHLLQYSGKSMGRDDVGMIARNMPFANTEEIFKDFTLGYDSAKNLMLALERGQKPDVDQEDDPDYMIKKLSNRMKQADFDFLDPQIQDGYRQVREMYHQLKAQKLAAAQQAKNEFIPQDGPMVACDMYVESDDKEKAPKRARVPYNALQWLVKQLEFQTGGLESLDDLDGASLGSIAGMLQRQGASGPAQDQMSPSPYGQPAPAGPQPGMAAPPPVGGI